MSLSFSEPEFADPKYTMAECKDRDATYAAPLYVKAEFMNNNTGEIKQQTVFMGDFPLMTDKGTFVINGTERVVVSQLVRSPGAYFERTADKTSDKDIFTAKIIPSRGAWFELEIDKRDQVGVRLDRKRKQSVTVLLKALGWTEGRSWKTFGAVRLDPRHPGEGHHRYPGRCPAGHLPQASPGRAADGRCCPGAAGEPVLQRRSATTWPRLAVTRSTASSASTSPLDGPDASVLNIDDIVAMIKFLVALHAGEKTIPGKRNGEDVDIRVERR